MTVQFRDKHKTAQVLTSDLLYSVRCTDHYSLMKRKIWKCSLNFVRNRVFLN
jgi:hypothetical protein